MRKHNGMRPQDIAILLKIIALGNQEWKLNDLSHMLSISLSEISESLNRSQLAGLIDFAKKKINRQNLMDFLEHGVRYVFPQQPGAFVRGVSTAHSHPSIRKIFISEMNYVWPDNKGEIMGQMIEPFYSNQVKAITNDKVFYKLLALVDMIRVGRVREVKYAVVELKKNILHESSY